LKECKTRMVPSAARYLMASMLALIAVFALIYYGSFH
jgi:hypothetical protein